jgi:hypothetical protein
VFEFARVAQSVRSLEMDRANHLWPDIAALTPGPVAINWMANACTLESMRALKLTRANARLSTQRLRASAGVRSKTYLDDKAHGMYYGAQSPALFAKFGPKFYSKTRAFVWVCKHGNLAMCRVLREWGMTVQDIRFSMDVALDAATYNGHLPILQFLKVWTTPLPGGRLDRLSVDDLRVNQNTALCSAAIGGQLEICQFLKEWRDPEPLPDGTWDRLTVNDVRARINDPLSGSAGHGHVHILQFLKAWRDPPSASHPAGDCLTIEDVRDNAHCALKLATWNGHVRVLQFFKDWVDAGSKDRLTIADVRVDGNVLLHWAAEYGYSDIILFFKNWTDPDGSRLTLEDVRSDNNHALRYAAMNGHLGVCQVLKEWGDEGVRESIIPWPSRPASCLGYADLHDFVLINPADPDAYVTEARDLNALQLAEKNGHTQVHKFLKDWETRQVAYSMGASFLSMIDPSLLQTLLSQFLPQ